jgi:hypothetical protein
LLLEEIGFGEKIYVVQSRDKFTINPSAWGHLISSSYCDVGRFFCRLFKFLSKLLRSLIKLM